MSILSENGGFVGVRGRRENEYPICPVGPRPAYDIDQPPDPRACRGIALPFSSSGGDLPRRVIVFRDTEPSRNARLPAN